MNVYEKLQAARVDLQGKSIPKSGKNKHAGYSYHELSDFMPHINQIFSDRKLCSVVSFTNELATLTVVNTEKPDETITFTSPMAEASLRGVQPIQNVGAVQTYQRRYLYMAALEIVEHDALDASEPSEGRNGEKASQSAPPQKASQRQHRRQAPRQQEPPTQAGENGGEQTPLIKAQRAYFKAASSVITEGREIAKEYAKWKASDWMNRDVDSFSKIPKPILDKMRAHVTETDASAVQNEVQVMKRDYGLSDPVPGAEDTTGGYAAQVDEPKQAQLV